MAIALDATYSLGNNLSGMGTYSREILFGMARTHPEQKFLFCYRQHRLLRSFRDSLPLNARRRLLAGAPRADLFHALNQRVDASHRRTVSTFHDLFVMTGEYSAPDFRSRFTEQARKAAERSDLIIAVSTFAASQVEELLHVERSRTRVVQHGARPPLAALPEARERENLILCVGAIQRRKNIARLVRAFDRMAGESRETWRLVLAGAPDGYGAAEELGAVDASPRRGNIDVLGYVSGAELESLYRRARIFAFPSLDEGFGMPVLDAMAHGVAVLTSNRSALPEVAGDAAILVDPEDTDAIADALTRLAGDEALREEYVRRGFERACQFTWESTVAQTWRVYQELL